MAVAKTKNATMEEQTQRNIVPTTTVEEQRSCPPSKLDDLLLSLQLDPKVVMALSDTFSKYPTAGKHFSSSLGTRFSNGQQHGDDVATVLDTAAAVDVVAVKVTIDCPS
mmetsp:Transcript_62430/g.69870  ORF Transcript_62430/g.69870 Transcript_62430/m.69870 type:complete len:109 (-) Transcript_62430:291-617(-)